MAGWAWGQNFVNAILGLAGTGPVSPANPLPVTQTGSAAPPAGYSALGDGRKVVAAAGTAEALASSTSCKAVLITAETDNTGIIAVGGSNVVAAQATRRGTPLQAGESAMLPVSDLALVYLDTTVNGDGVTFSYFG